MARGKKATSPRAAILPKEKQPFPVPENWFWTDIDSINQYSGVSIDPMKRPDTTFELYSVPSSADDHPEIITGSEIGSTKQSVIKNDVLLCKINPKINRVWKVAQYTDNELMASSEWIVIRNSVINPDYLMFCFRTQYFREFMLSNVSGVGGSLMRAQPKFVKKYPIPIPPIPEQHRIVDRIERLFAKLNEAKEKAQAVVDGFELRKSAILHKAFTGELTERWRKEHGVGLDSWEVKSLIEVASLQTGLMKGKRHEGETVFLPYLRVANVQDGFLDLTEIKEIEVSPSNIARYSLKRGDVLFTEGGDFDKLGRGTVWEEEIPNCLHQNHIFVVRPDESVLNSYFLSYQAGSKYGKAYFLSCSKQTTNLASINSTQLKGFPVKLPSLAEQIEIVSTITNLLALEQQAKEAAEAVLAQIDAMKKAILARAFCGALGTNDPAEEWAGELLKSMI